MPSKKRAKMAAAYEACKQLHKIGELDDYLRPVEESSEDDDSSDEEATVSGKPKQGTKRSKQKYQRKVGYDTYA